MWHSILPNWTISWAKSFYSHWFIVLFNLYKTTHLGGPTLHNQLKYMHNVSRKKKKNKRGHYRMDTSSCWYTRNTIYLNLKLGTNLSFAKNQNQYVRINGRLYAIGEWQFNNPDVILITVKRAHKKVLNVYKIAQNAQFLVFVLN